MSVCVGVGSLVSVNVSVGICDGKGDGDGVVDGGISILVDVLWLVTFGVRSGDFVDTIETSSCEDPVFAHPYTKTKKSTEMATPICAVRI